MSRFADEPRTTNFELNMKIGLASDHAGFDMKEIVKAHLIARGFEVQDFGTHSADSADYPDYAHPLSQAINTGELAQGIMVCGSGQGMCMTANKYPEVRAALVWTAELASLTRQHNDANVLCLPGRFIEPDVARAAVDAFLNSDFEGGRHQRRVDKISKSPN